MTRAGRLAAAVGVVLLASGLRAAPIEPIVPALSPNAIRAVERAAADGQAAYRAGKFVEAARAYRTAYDLYPTAGMAFNLARALHRAGNLHEAAVAYRLVVGGTPELMTKARSYLADVERALGQGTLELQVQPAEAKAEIDGLPVDIGHGQALRLSAGRHQLRVFADGFVTHVHDVEIVGAGTRRINVKLDPLQAPGDRPGGETPATAAAGSAGTAQGGVARPPAGGPTGTAVQAAGGATGGPGDAVVRAKPRRLAAAGWATLGTAAALVVTGGVLYAVGGKGRDALRGQQDDTAPADCDPRAAGCVVQHSQRDALDRAAKADRLVGSAVGLWAVGGAALATAVVLLVVDRPATDDAGTLPRPEIRLDAARDGAVLTWERSF